MYNSLKLLIYLLLLTPFIAQAQRWNPENHPGKILNSITYKFHKLPLRSEISNKKIAWPANHWASIDGGITYRWTATHAEKFKYKSPSYKKLKLMSQIDRDELSPAEKFSIMIGDYQYGLVKFIWNETSPQMASWSGICHGVAPASIHYAEPRKKQYKNRDGIILNFYSSDIKGLLSYYYARVLKPNARIIGKRCNYYEGANGSHYNSCDDVNAGAFHLVMTNILGLEKKPFLADIDRYLEVWNHAAVNYESYIVDEYAASETSAYGTVKRIRVQSSVTYASAISRQEEAILGTEEAYYLDHPYDYYLDLDKYGNIIGGEWISEIRPDFVWTQTKGRFYGKWRNLQKILNFHE